MDCQTSDSKKLFKVFDASKRRRTRKKRDGHDDSNSVATDGSTSGCQHSAMKSRTASAKASLERVPNSQPIDVANLKANRDSSPDIPRSQDGQRSSRSPRRHRRPGRDGISLALKAGLVSTPRSDESPHQEGDAGMEKIPRDHDSFIYQFLEEAIKMDKKKQRHSRRHEDHRNNYDREQSAPREHRHHRRRREEAPTRDHEKHQKDETQPLAMDQTLLLETFAKLCSQMKENNFTNTGQVTHSQSHKSLQCEVEPKRDSYVPEHRPRHRSRDHSPAVVPSTRIRSQEQFPYRVSSRDQIVSNVRNHPNKCACCYEKQIDSKYCSKLDVRTRPRDIEEDRYRDYQPEVKPTRSRIDPRDHYRTDPRAQRDYREYDDRDRRIYEEERKRMVEQRTSRSFDVTRDYVEDDRGCRRTVRSDCNKYKKYNPRYDDRILREKDYDDRDREKYYEDRHIEVRDRNFAALGSKEKHQSRRNLDSRYDRTSLESKEEERERYSERERDSGLSVADGETSTVSGRSNCLRVVKQEISEQREAMDKMMKLWKELMRCFKGMSQMPGQNDKGVNETAENARESAAAQLRLWRECMRRYETVARDVGDTDARLMEEINKQRSEMAEMATMWQECLQRYRDMSNDFNSLKQQLTTSESPNRMAAPAPPPLVCAEGEGSVPVAPYRLPPTYPQPPPHMGAAFMNGGSPLRSRASAPPNWWWCGERPQESQRRRSSPESRGSRERDRRHRHKDREDSRYKEKSSKPNAARSEHRHRKR